MFGAAGARKPAQEGLPDLRLRDATADDRGVEQQHPDISVAPRSWLCPEPADRVRAVDMEERLRPYRRASFVVLAIALLLCGHWVGWWELIPLAVAVVGFLIVDRSLATAPRPEFTIAAAWLLSEFAIAGSIALTGGPRSPALAWLVTLQMTETVYKQVTGTAGLFDRAQALAHVRRARRDVAHARGPVAIGSQAHNCLAANRCRQAARHRTRPTLSWLPFPTDRRGR